MFLEEDDFDEQKPQQRLGPKHGGRGLSPPRESDDFEENLGSVPSSSRARMLAQQREIQLKKRESAAASTGMVRSSMDSESSARKSAENQFTPAVRQFSAPKSVKDSSADAPEHQSEFSRSARNNKPVVTRSDKQAPGKKPNKPQKPYGGGRAAPDDGYKRNAYSDEEEEAEQYEKSPARRGPRSYSYMDDEEDYEEDYGSKDKWSDRADSSAGGAKQYHRRERYDDEWEEEAPKIVSPTRGPKAPATEAVTPLDLSDMRKFLTTPLPKGAGVVQCNIRRDKNGINKLYPVYSLYLKQEDIFLLNAKKRANNKTSNYLISMGEGDLAREGSNYMGKLRSNFVGTEFQVFDDGYNPKDDPEFNGQEMRNELGAVMYAANVWGSRGPRKMQVALPAVDQNNHLVLPTPGDSNGDDLLNRIRDRNCRDTVYLINKPPRWHDQVGAYVLNFNGRVTMASVKNFQLVDPEEQNTVVLQFGRVGKDEFTMDMHYPITPLQAFGVTLSSFDSKIACD